ncbi:MAG: SPFH domain-containing protein [Fimbriimonadaceae bacterium]|jgi:membrane protease subunit (stomatin/prohibitin family)|nr:SPFH domain-containing protein [Fimbriimonadaceae bacterium]
MSIFDKIRGEFIDIIEWLDDSNDTMVYRFERHNNEIKYGAKLTVRESQQAVFVEEGQYADVFNPGMYTLETQNLPILSTLKGWKYGFNSPFKAEVYFVNTKRFTDLKWGTMNPIMMRDPDFGMVRVRAFGSYVMRVVDAKKFLSEVVGTNWEFTTDQISDQIRNNIVSAFSKAVAEMKMPVLDLYSMYQDMGTILTNHCKPILAEMGIELINLLIENVSVPPEVEQAIDTRSKMGAVGDLQKYMQFQAADAMVKGAENPGGAGAMVGQMMAGMMMGQTVGQTMAQQPMTPPPLPTAKTFHVAVNGQQQGPYDMAGLQALASQGGLRQDTLVWSAGMANWIAAKEVAELAPLFANVPPPIPPQS